MYGCELCNVILQKRNKTKHDQSKKYKHYSNLILNRFVIRNAQAIKFKKVFDPYFIEHTRKFIFFTVRISLRHYDEEYNIDHEINVSNYATYKIQSKHYSILVRD